MSRPRLAGAALLSLAFLPGCGILTGDRTLCERWRDCWRGDRCEGVPVGYPVVEGGCPGGFAAPIPTGGCPGGCATPIPGGFPLGGIPPGGIAPGGIPYQGPPIYMGGPGPGASVPLGSETLPQPGFPQTMPPRIPAPKIEEGGKGKEFELEGAGRKGPVGPALPVGSVK